MKKQRSSVEVEWYTFFTDIFISSRGLKNWSNSITKIQNNEWQFKENGINHGIIKKMGIEIPTFSLFLDIERSQNYYFFKIMFPILFLLIITWSVFWIDPKDLESRITISTVCLLTLIAYNFIIDQDLPKLSYLTFIDSFILVSYLFAGIPTIQSVTSKYLLQHYKQIYYINFDYFCRILIPLFYLIIITFLFFYFIY